MAGSWAMDSKFEHLIEASKPQGGSTDALDLKTLMQQATTAQEAQGAVENFLKSSIAAAIGSNIDAVDVEKPLYDFGGKFIVFR